MSLLRLLLAALALCLGGMASAQTVEELVARLPEGSFEDRGRVVSALAATGDPRVVAVLSALVEGDLAAVRPEGTMVILKGRDAVDALTGAALGQPGRNAEKVKVNNSLRRDIRTAMGILTLRDPDPARRLSAADAAFRSADPEQIASLDAALAAEQDPRVAARLALARAAAVVKSGLPSEARVEAAALIGRQGGQEALSVLTPLLSAPDAAVAQAAQDAVAEIEQARMFWNAAQNVWFGLSMGSVLLLAAVGLAITFGVMGVINMAHGELVMLGAYTTYVVQEAIRTHAPGLFDWSLLIALPLAFAVAGGVGVAIERGIVRHLYGRPLETLLATWGVSLILQQAVRSAFGPNNREVGNPSWMSGAFDLGQMTVTWNRLWIICFALAVFAALLFTLKKTPIGLQMRAVTQNRPMAANMGIKTGRVDALTFGLGAGIAGLAGVALSQIDNVSPNLGQTYIVDSFMVVVFGGAGNIWGTFAAAFSLGIVNKFLEPFAGAVLAKILILVFIILFIQKRPRGLFAVKGRFVDA